MSPVVCIKIFSCVELMSFTLTEVISVLDYFNLIVTTLGIGKSPDKGVLIFIK